MAFEIIDPTEFCTNGVIREDDFLHRADAYDWERFRGARVLIRGCASIVIPPWVYMIITGRLAGVAGSVRFGNEHDHIVVCRSPQKQEKA
jgi:hypothetical protein